MRGRLKWCHRLGLGLASCLAREGRVCARYECDRWVERDGDVDCEGVMWCCGCGCGEGKSVGRAVWLCGSGRKRRSSHLVGRVVRFVFDADGIVE
jgi:hypothetical protein